MTLLLAAEQIVKSTKYIQLGEESRGRRAEGTELAGEEEEKRRGGEGEEKSARRLIGSRDETTKRLKLVQEAAALAAK